MIYLNNASTSYPKPQIVIDKITEYIKSIPFHSERAGLEYIDNDVRTSCRIKLSELINCDNPNNIAFTSGSTESLNLAINGLNFKEDHIITTSMEHNSVYRPLKRMEELFSNEITIVDCNEEGMVFPEDIKSSIKTNTRAVVINHCSNVTGTINDIKKISDIVHQHGIIFIVDASQSIGSIPIDVKEMDIDILAFTGHKNLFGLQGIGGIYIKDGIHLDPLKVGGTGIRSDLLYQPEERPIVFEAGTPNMAGIVSLEAGVSFVLEKGLEKIKNEKEKKFKKILAYLHGNRNIIIYGQKDVINRAPIVSFNFKNLKPQDAGYILENSFGILIRTGLHCAPLIHKSLKSYPLGSIRVSISSFTTEKEIDLFINAIDEISIMK